MKRQTKIYFLLLIILLLITGCVKDGKLKSTNYPTLNFIDKCAFKETNNTWSYYFCIEFGKDSSGNFTVPLGYDFNGLDLVNKDKTDNYYIPFYDSNTGELVSKGKVNTQALLYGDKTRKEVKAIYNLFNDKKPNKEITEDDLKELKLNYIDKDLILNIFNDALNAEPITLGKYTNISMFNTITKSFSNYEVMVGYLLYYGNIKYIKIDFVDKNTNKYLSQLVDENKASNDQEQDYKNIKNLEETIIRQQKFNVDDIFKGKIIETSIIEDILIELNSSEIKGR